MCGFSNTISKLLLLLLLHYLLAIDAAKLRIVGGQTTTINKVKYIVSLRRPNGKFFCGGSLVTRNHVVTAAHCVKGLKLKDVFVHGGATHLSQVGVRRAVSKIFVPKAFNMKDVSMDVAVIRLYRPMTGKNIATIPLCSHALSVKDWVQVSGWGLSSEISAKPSPQLRTVKVQVISKNQCTSNYRSVMKLTRTMMCASVPGVNDACMGDSGGPLVHRGQLCGIVSFGVGCARRQYPGVYTIVNTVKSFIRNSIHKSW